MVPADKEGDVKHPFLVRNARGCHVGEKEQVCLLTRLCRCPRSRSDMLLIARNRAQTLTEQEGLSSVKVCREQVSLTTICSISSCFIEADLSTYRFRPFVSLSIYDTSVKTVSVTKGQCPSLL